MRAMTLPEIVLAMDEDHSGSRPPADAVAVGPVQVAAYAKWRRRASPERLLALALGEKIDFESELRAMGD